MAVGFAIEKERGTEKKKKVLHHIEITPAENGGHTMRHHFDNSGPGVGYHEPEDFVFSKSEGPEAHDHLEKHLGMEQE